MIQKWYQLFSTRIFCLFGLHKYKTRTYAKLGSRTWTEDICVRCTYSPTWNSYPEQEQW